MSALSPYKSVNLIWCVELIDLYDVGGCMRVFDKSVDKWEIKLYGKDS